MSAYTNFIFLRDQGGANSFVLPPTLEIQGAIVEANAEETFTLPSHAEKYLVIFDYDRAATVYVAINQTAAVPTGAFAAVNSRVMPAAYLLNAGDVVHMITAVAAANTAVTAAIYVVSPSV